MKTMTILGERDQSGAYLLRMRIMRDVAVCFGRFQDGRPIPVPQGEALYIGSAMGEQGSMTLARRLLRHATRHDKQNPQLIRREMLSAFVNVGLGKGGLKPPDEKKLFWNIDYLLEEDVVALTHVVAIRTKIKIEDELAHMLEAEPQSVALAEGLGAHDKRKQTHVLLIEETADWWQQLPARLQSLLNNRST